MGESEIRVHFDRLAALSSGFVIRVCQAKEFCQVGVIIMIRDSGSRFSAFLISAIASSNRPIDSSAKHTKGER